MMSARIDVYLCEVPIQHSLPRDLKDLNEVKVRSANTGPEKHMMCYLKTDIEKR